MAAEISKSALDGVPVDDRTYQLLSRTNQNHLDIVGHCPQCGSPIYGNKRIAVTASPVSRPSCNCAQHHKDLSATMRTT